MAYKQSGMDFGNKKPGPPKEIPPHIKKLSQTNYKDSKSKSTPTRRQQLTMMSIMLGLSRTTQQTASTALLVG